MCNKRDERLSRIMTFNIDIGSGVIDQKREKTISYFILFIYSFLGWGYKIHSLNTLVLYKKMGSKDLPGKS